MGCQGFLAWGLRVFIFPCRLNIQGKAFSEHEVLDDIFSVFYQYLFFKKAFQASCDNGGRTDIHGSQCFCGKKIPAVVHQDKF